MGQNNVKNILQHFTFHMMQHVLKCSVSLELIKFLKQFISI